MCDYAQSTAQAYVWMEEKYPDLFKEIQQRVKEGRWEIVGGMWVEPDLNMPSGESLVRQILIGKRYFQQKFGVDARIGWNPDSFGYNWQLPQIYKRSGLDYFVTQKMSWNDTTMPCTVPRNPIIGATLEAVARIGKCFSSAATIWTP